MNITKIVMDMKKHIPNILSTLRLAMAFALPVVYFKSPIAFTTFFIAGDLTDAIDGYLSRKWKVQSKYGSIMDPIADKTFNGTALILVSIFSNPLLFFALFFESAIAIVTFLRTKEKQELGVSKIGKKKTILLFLTIATFTVPPLSISLLVGTLGLQGITTYKYIKQYNEEKKKKQIILGNEESTKNIPIQTDDENNLKKRNILSKLEDMKREITIHQEEAMGPTLSNTYDIKEKKKIR